MLPHFMIIGAQKSATTFLQTVLSSHPSIFIPNGEVPFFEDPDYGNGDLYPLKKVYQHAPSGALLGLKRPNYLAKPECPERIARHLPNAKLIIILRNPVSRAVSAYYHYMGGKFIPCVELNRGMLNLIDGNYKNKYPRSSEILEFGLYAKHLRRYFDYFPRQNFYIMSQEDFLNNKAKSIEDVCAFLGVDYRIKSQRLEKVKQKGVYSLSRIRLHRTANSLLHTKSSDGMRSHLRRGSLAKKGTGYALLVFDRLFAQFVSNERPNLNAELRARIKEFYKQDISDLELLVDTKFSDWHR